MRYLAAFLIGSLVAFADTGIKTAVAFDEENGEVGGELAPSEVLASEARSILGDERFGGISIDSATGDMNIVVVDDFPEVLGGRYPDLSDEKLKALRQVGDHVALSTLSTTLKFISLKRNARYSATQLEQKRSTLERDYRKFEQQGIWIAGFGTDYDRNRVRVNIGESTTASPEEVKAALGPMVELVWGPDVLGRGTGSRGDNRAPFSGSATYISELGNGICTGGVVWRKSAENYDNFVSAAHCTGPDLRWKNPATNEWVAKTWDSSLLHSDRGDWSYADWFGAGTNGHPSVWTADNDFRFVSDYFIRYHSAVEVCFSGSASGERCGFDVSLTNECIRLSFPGMPPNVMFCGMNFAFKPGSVPATLVGDSGAAVYRSNSDGKLTIAGVVSAIHLKNPSIFIYTPVVTIRENLAGTPLTCAHTDDC